MINSKGLIQIKKETAEIMEKLRVGDETYNSILYRNLKPLIQMTGKKENGKHKS